jgi:hypothetical protein
MQHSKFCREKYRILFYEITDNLSSQSFVNFFLKNWKYGIFRLLNS